MEILKTLEESADSLILEDLDFFETELATGDGYEDAYVSECRKKIRQIRRWMTGEIDLINEPEETKEGENDTSTENPDTTNGTINKRMTSRKKALEKIIVELDEIAPDGSGPIVAKMPPLQQVQADLVKLRDYREYKSLFKEYVRGSEIITADFLDKNFSVFDSWEIDTIVSVKQLGEEFLEKYFGAIDHDKIARYQLFSESFFMKHFSQMDAEIVLERGKNEWRKKEKRSKQLDVFLRLKGVKN